MAYNPSNPNGQATMANSQPVAISSDQTSILVDSELPAAAALADAVANPTTPTAGAASIAFNGATWDRVKTQDAVAGNGANNTVVGILAASLGPGFSLRYNPTNLGTAANSASAVDVEGANSLILGINTTTTGTIIFEATADNTNWYSIEVFDALSDAWVTGQNLTPTAGKVYYVACSGLRQVRIRTVSTLGATVAHFITLSNGSQVLSAIDTGFAPHNFGYTLKHFDGEYTTAQTGTVLWTPTTGKKFAITDITISVGGTTSGIVTLFDAASATTTYTAGTTPAIFRGTFAPSTTANPGVVKSFNVPYISTTANNVVHVTTSAAMTVYIQLNGYEI